MATRTVRLTEDITYTVPAGVTSLTVECWGAGASGGDGINSGGGGGGGGAYAAKTFSVTPGATYTVTIGQPGVLPDHAAKGGDGGDSSFSTEVIAKGGIGGDGSYGSTGLGGPGGSAASSTGTTKYSGGTGGNGQNSGDTGGGGGGAAGATGDGGNGGNTTSGNGNGEGGKGGAYGVNSASGGPGQFPGGGGGGGEGNTFTNAGATGGRGCVKISYDSDNIVIDTTGVNNKDAYIDGYSGYVNSNYGSNTLGYIYNYSGWQIVHTLMNFTLPTVPGTILDVRLWINCLTDRSFNSGYLYIVAHELDADWAEDTVTWNNAPTYDSTVIGRFQMPGYAGWQSIPLMGPEALNPLTLGSGDTVNIRIKSDVESSHYNGQAQWASKEYTDDTSLRPYLEVVYETEGGGGVTHKNFRFSGL